MVDLQDGGALREALDKIHEGGILELRVEDALCLVPFLPLSEGAIRKVG